MTLSDQGEFQRTQMVAVIRANPGIHVRQLAAVTGVSWGTCLHHTRRLAATGRIACRKLRGLSCLFDLSQGAVSTRVGAALLRNTTRARVARQVAENPGMIQRALAEALGVACSVVHRQLVVLESNGLVRRVQSGRGVAIFPGDSLAAALILVPDPSRASAGLQDWTQSAAGDAMPSAAGENSAGHGAADRWASERDGTEWASERDGTEWASERDGTEWASERDGTEWSSERDAADTWPSEEGLIDGGSASAAAPDLPGETAPEDFAESSDDGDAADARSFAAAIDLTKTEVPA